MSLPNLGSVQAEEEAGTEELNEEALNQEESPEDNKKDEKVETEEPERIIDRRGRVRPKKDHTERLRIRKALKPIQNRISKALIILFTRTFKEPFEDSDPDLQYQELLSMAFDGQLKYFSETINLIKKKQDPLSLELNAKKNKIEISTVVFEKLHKIIADEYEAFLDADFDWEEIMKLEYKSMSDTQQKSRIGFWSFIFVGMEFRRLVKDAAKTQKLRELQVEAKVLEPLYSSSYIYDRLVAIMIDVSYQVVKRLSPFMKAMNYTELIPNKIKSGYLFSQWMRFRYNTPSQKRIHHENYVQYFIRTFGTLHGRAPEPIKDAYNRMFILAFKAVEKRMQEFEINFQEGKKIPLLNMLNIIRSDYNNELVLREYDSDGNLMNQPGASDEAGDYIDWFFEIVRDLPEKHHNIFYYRRNQEIISIDPLMFNFVLPAIRGVNEKGEKILIPWF